MPRVDKLKTNAMAYYSLHGKSVISLFLGFEEGKDYRLSRKTGFAMGWVEKFLCPFYNSFANDYVLPCKVGGFCGDPGFSTKSEVWLGENLLGDCA